LDEITSVAVPSKWTVQWYTTTAGVKPLKAFLEELEGDEENLADALALLELLEARGNVLRPPRSEPLGGGLFELRAHPRPVRIFYVFQPGRRIVVLDGIVKKRARIPGDVLKRMRGYQRDVESRIER
jgi:hypothetical protein